MLNACLSDGPTLCQNAVISTATAESPARSALTSVLAVLAGGWSHLIAISVRISLTIRPMEDLVLCLFSIPASPFVKYLFKYWPPFYFLITNSWEFLMGTRYQARLRHRNREYFLPTCEPPFQLLNRAERFRVDEAQCARLFPLGCVFCVLSEKSLPAPRLGRCSPLKLP